MTLTLNGSTLDWSPEQPPTLITFLDQQLFSPPYAVAVNRRFIPKHRYAETILSSGDAIEVLRAVTGG